MMIDTSGVFAQRRADAVRTREAFELDDLVLHPDAIDVVLDRPPPGRVRVRLRHRVERDRRRVDPPVVEDLGHVVHLARLFGDAQDEVPVLASRRSPGADDRPRRARVRRTMLKWQVYIWLRSRSGDQSGFRNGSEWFPSRSILSSSVYR